MAKTRLIAVLLLAVVLLALPPVAQWMEEPFYISLASRMLVFALAAMSLDLILGYGGMVSFGHAAFVGIGAYVVGILTFHAAEGAPLLGFIPGTMSGWIAWPLAMVFSGLFALVIGAISLRTKGIYFIMITLAFAQMFYFFFVSLRAYGGEDGLSLASRSTFSDLINLRDRTTFYYVALGVVAVVWYVLERITNSRFGWVLKGARENERRMVAIGFPTYRYKLVAFVIAGAVAGLSGALLANQANFVSPAFMHWTRSGEIMVMVILGGMGTLIGPLFGAFLFLVLEEVLSSHTEHWQVIFGPLLLLIVIFAKRGLYGIIERRRTA